VQAFASAAVGFDAEISVQTAAGSLTPATTAASVPPGTQCVVSFTWDDGVSSNPSEAALLAARGWRGTFYIQTGVVGTSGFVTWQQVRDLEAAGHEIGSHCVDHVYLDTTGDPQGQLTNSRNALLSNWVAAPDSIAYPYYVTDRAIVGMAAQAGYTSGRRAGGGTEAMPPRDGTNFELRAYDVVQTDPARWRTIVTDAEAAPGVPWVIFILHRLGPGVNIGNNQADQATVTAFWDWLALRSPATIVRPVSAQIVPAAHTARFTSHRWTQSSDINSFPPSADTAGWTFGKEFTVGSAAMLTGYQFAVSTGFTAVQESGVEYALFRVTGAGAGELVAGSRVRSGWIVRGTQGTTVVWNRTPLPGGLALTPGQRYKAAVYWAGGAPWYTLIPGPYWAPPGWGGSGLARGPLSILSAAASTDGQHTRVAAGAPPPPSGEWRLVKAWDGDEWAELAP
jgi:peptidoglycan/xylan/chitin deacetylase (PgdA/CDA1 family)